MSISIRAFIPSDEPRLQECCRTGYSVAFGEVSEFFKPRAHEILEDHLIGRGLVDIEKGLSERLEGIGWTAESDGVIAGYAQGHMRRERIPELSNLFVHADYQRYGIASRLMDQAEDWARTLGGNKMYLKSSHLLVGAHKFYMRRGYVFTGSFRLPDEFAEITMLEFERTL